VGSGSDSRVGVYVNASGDGLFPSEECVSTQAERTLANNKVRAIRKKME
jgi:hypothetical protein